MLAHAPGQPVQVCIAYKANVQPDGRLLDLLEAKLRAHGHQVFIDRHLSIGVQWAQEIESKIRGAGALIVLLSAASTQSEMVEYEVEIGHDSFQQRGKPCLLPIRVAYAGPLPQSFASRLDAFHHCSWNGPQDDQE